MATIPIEIVLQDADSPVDPTPTPENGEETNIVVPNTGTISNDGNNSGGISSSIGIILPIVIAILAIVTAVVLIVRKHYRHHKRFSSVMSRKEKLATVVSSTIAILAVTVLVGNLVIPATNAASDDINDVGGSSTTASEEGTYLETEDKITITAIINKDSEEDTVTVSAKDILYATTDASGYTVTMSMEEDALTSNLYLNGDETSEYYIAPVENARLGDNTWGYRLNEEDEDYLPVSLADNPATVAEGEEAVEHEEINIYYTVRVNKELPLGTYSGEIEYNIEGIYGFPDTLTTMQGMTHEICEDVTTPGNKVTDPVPTATLRDTRDNKTYTIAKLADGNCWMTQNLNLAGGSVITGELSDVPENYTLPTANGFREGNQLPESSQNGFDNDDMAFVYNTNNTVNDCQSPGCYSYYSWVAATVGSSYMTNSMNAPYSICPNGWKLPTTLENTLSNSDLGSLVFVYGDGSNMSTQWTADFYDNVGPNTIPNFVLAGRYVNSSFGGGGNSGLYWSSTKKDTTSVLYLNFGSSFVMASNSIAMRVGGAVRCVAR